jgi:hypothetical protein
MGGSGLRSSKPDRYAKSVRLSLGTQACKERESSDDSTDAGRMTATARSDIGANLKPDRKRGSRMRVCRAQGSRWRDYAL